MLREFYRKENISLRDAFGGQYPEYFLHPAAEYRALVRSCGVIDLTHWRVLRIRGRDRTRFLNAMLTTEVGSLEPNRGAYSMRTTVKGKILVECFVFARAEEHLAILSQGDCAPAIGDLQKHIIADDVSIEDVSASFGVLAVEGPQFKEMRKRLFEPGPFPASPLDAVERDFEHFKIFVMQNSVTGEAGFHLMAPAEEILRLRTYLVQAARASDGLPVGYAAWNIRRLENGLPWYGLDFSGDNFPQEARLSHAVSYTKGCFRGQETLARLEHRGHVNRLLVGLAPVDDRSPAEWQTRLEALSNLAERSDGGELSRRASDDSKFLDLSRTIPASMPLRIAEESGGSGNAAGTPDAGWITSAVYSLALKKPLFLGYVRRELSEANATYSINGAFGSLDLREIELPLESS
jgi:folate-binding protein YgfZ